MDIHSELIDLVNCHFAPYLKKYGVIVACEKLLFQTDNPVKITVDSIQSSSNEFNLVQFFKDEKILDSYSKDVVFKFLSYFNHNEYFYDNLLQEGETTILKSLIGNDDWLVDYVVKNADYSSYLIVHVPFSLLKPKTIKSIITQLSQTPIFQDIDFQKDLYHLLPTILNEYQDLLSLFDIQSNKKIQAKINKTELVTLSFDLKVLYNFNLEKHYYKKGFEQALTYINQALLEYQKELNIIDANTHLKEGQLIIICEGYQLNEQLLEQVITSHLTHSLIENNLNNFEDKISHIDLSIIEKFNLDNSMTHCDKKRMIKL